ncbi:MAG: FecR domain-containing protein [Acidobacteria bacterium]|nr:FecR domain-containing protein [Acidobacteriota bacterium]
MDNNFRRYYVEWWSIRKSTIYAVVAIVVTLLLLIGGIWWLWQNDWVITPPAEQVAPKDSATIVSFEGNVRIIRVATRVTERVTKSTFVQAGDTVQTQADGRAQIRMIDGSILSVRPNSTVVISDSSSILGGTSVRVKLDDGQIRVRTENQPESSNNIVELKESQNKMGSQTEASFNIDPNSNRGEIRINRGGLETEVGGEKVQVNENEYLSIDNNKIGSKEKLLGAPTLKEPSPSKQIYSNTGVNLTFVWSEPENYPGAEYALQIAQSPFFVAGKLKVEKSSLTSTSLSLANLQPGTYFWRARASVRSGQVSEWSEPSKFTIINKTGSGGIDVNELKVENVGGGVFIIQGITKPGATVTILGRETFARSDGTFQLQISTSGSTASISISDEKGNHSERTIALRNGAKR